LLFFSAEVAAIPMIYTVPPRAISGCPTGYKERRFISGEPNHARPRNGGLFKTNAGRGLSSNQTELLAKARNQAGQPNTRKLSGLPGSKRTHGAASKPEPDVCGRKTSGSSCCDTL
jgi:hypothetical protein